MRTIRISGLDGEPVTVAERTLTVLADRLAGDVLRPGEPGFAQAVTIWNGMITKRPAVVVQPVCADDVCEAVHFARANGVLLSVKGGGHNAAGTSLADGGGQDQSYV